MARGALISRDPFARTELHRERRFVGLPGQAGVPSCFECGGFAHISRLGNAKLFAYRTESDGGRVDFVPGLFCSIGCMRSYHGH